MAFSTVPSFRRHLAYFPVVAMALTAAAFGAQDVPVPPTCTSEVNRRLSDLLESHIHRPVDNVMVCGETISPSRTRRGGPHGDHDILPVLANLPDGRTMLIQVVINEDLDGRITAPKGAMVFAFGQAFFDSAGRFAAGIHDVHCSTHRGAYNGWVVVNGRKSPSASCPVH